MNLFSRRTRRIVSLLIHSAGVIGLLFSAACSSTPSPTPVVASPVATVAPPTPALSGVEGVTPIPLSPAPASIGLGDTATAVAADVGQVMNVVEGDPQTVIFVFEERHDSRLGQVEIAIMLNRLYEDYGLRHIGLEGHPATEPPLDLAWSHRDPPFTPSDTITGHEDVIGQTLEDGEISSAELIGLVYYDAVIHGIDDAELYAFDPPAEAWDAPRLYLYQIALSELSATERVTWDALYKQKEYDAAFEYAVTGGDHTAEVWSRWSDPLNILSAEQWLADLETVRRQADLVGANVSDEDKANLDAMSDYFEHVSQRSEALAANMLEVAAANPGAPLAMTIGALHTARVAELLTEAGVSFAVIRPQSLAEGSQAGLLSPEAYQRKQQGLSVAPAGWLGSFLDGRKKPPPTSDKEPYRKEVGLRKIAEEILTEAGDSLSRLKASMSREEFDKKYKDGSLVKDLVRELQAVMDKADLAQYGIASIEISGVGLSEPLPAIEPSVGFRITDLEGKVFVGVVGHPDEGGEPEVHMEERLLQSKSNVTQAPPAPESNPGAQQVSSNAWVTWSP